MVGQVFVEVRPFAGAPWFPVSVCDEVSLSRTFSIAIWRNE